MPIIFKGAGKLFFADTYATIKHQHGFSIRNSIKIIALDTISLVENLKDDNAFLKKRIQFLYIHHVFKDEEIKLKQLIEFLSKNHIFISHSEAVNRILDNKIDKPYICISSDDGFKNNLRAAEIFESFGIKACFFICPAIINETDYNKIKNFCAQRLHFPPVEFLNWKDVDHLLKKGHEIGSHTMTHINCADSLPNVVEEELNSSYRIIRERCGVVKHFAYPYGRFFHFNEAARNMMFKAGYQSCAAAERGCHVKQATLPVKENLLIRRDNVVLDWKLSHIKIFLKHNATKASLQQNGFPY